MCAVETAHMEMQENWADLESALYQTELDKSDYEHTAKDLERSVTLCFFICVALTVFPSTLAVSLSFGCLCLSLLALLFLSSFVVMM